MNIYEYLWIFMNIYEYLWCSVFRDIQSIFYLLTSRCKPLTVPCCMAWCAFSSHLQLCTIKFVIWRMQATARYRCRLTCKPKMFPTMKNPHHDAPETGYWFCIGHPQCPACSSSTILTISPNNPRTFFETVAIWVLFLAIFFSPSADVDCRTVGCCRHTRTTGTRLANHCGALEPWSLRANMAATTKQRLSDMLDRDDPGCTAPISKECTAPATCKIMKADSADWQNFPEWPCVSLPTRDGSQLFLDIYDISDTCHRKTRRKSYHTSHTYAIHMPYINLRKSSCMVQWSNDIHPFVLQDADLSKADVQDRFGYFIAGCFANCIILGHWGLRVLHYYGSDIILQGCSRKGLACPWKRLHSMDACYLSAYWALNSSNQRRSNTMRFFRMCDIFGATLMIRAVTSPQHWQNTFPGHDGRWSDRQ